MINTHKIHYLSFPKQPSIPTGFERFWATLSKTSSTPTAYGWFHLLWLFLTLALCILVGFTCQKVKEKRVKTVLGATSIVLLVLEIYKQFAYSYDTQTNSWSYSWAIFPFQFCSTPMYIMGLATIVKSKKLQNALYSFLATYSLFAGALVMLIPNSVFCEIIGINIQTMFHHGAMVVIGVFLYVTKAVEIKNKTVIQGAPVFTVLLFIALVMNATFAAIGDGSDTFNMFYIARSGNTPMDFIDEIFKVVPYPIILLAYAGGFTALGWAISLLAKGIQKIYTHAQIQCEEKVKKQNPQQNTIQETEENNTVKETL